MNERTEQAMRDSFEKDYVVSGAKRFADGDKDYVDGSINRDWKVWRLAWKAAQASLATPQPQSVHPDALEALKNYQQADESGVMVLVSRQALDEAIRALIEPLSADEHKEQQDKDHDSIALRASRKVMALNNEPVMPTSQLQARIQCIIYDAIKELP